MLTVVLKIISSHVKQTKQHQMIDKHTTHSILITASKPISSKAIITKSNKNKINYFYFSKQHKKNHNKISMEKEKLVEKRKEHQP